MERTLSGCRPIAASFHRELLLHQAQEDYLHLDVRRLDRTGRAKITELADATIEEVEVIYADKEEREIMASALASRRSEETTQRIEREDAGVSAGPRQSEA